MHSPSHNLPCINLRTVFLDRDGVLNKKMPEGQYVRSWDEFHLLPGVVEAIGKLNRRGIRVIVVSNQRGVALKLFATADVEAIHTHLKELLASHGAHIDAFYFCPHEKGQCNCRKPLSGMFEQAVAEFPDISAAAALMIGDSYSDIEFGARLGMQTILIESDAESQLPDAERARALAGQRFSSLAEAVCALLRLE